MQVHLVDGTYELFRQFFAPGRPAKLNTDGLEIGAARSVVRNLFGMLEEGATHIGVATDHIIESFRNDLYAPYKDGSGIDPEIRNQFEPLEMGIAAAGFALFAMVEFEADDGLASAAAVAARDPTVDRVLICTADKDLAQSVRAGRVLQLDSRRNRLFDVPDVIEKFGVPPESIPDLLALTGDSADGFPGLKGWGAKSSAAVLAHYGTIENIPHHHGQWEVTVRGAAKLAETLRENFAEALLFKTLATLDEDAPTISDVEELRWVGPTPQLWEAARILEAPDLIERAQRMSNRPF
ncbi:MAG: flap endonuclease [Acidimicrobiales bacterium]|nr:flap endonuclease [Acidimicrobiales bacterium]